MTPNLPKKLDSSDPKVMTARHKAYKKLQLACLYGTVDEVADATAEYGKLYPQHPLWFERLKLSSVEKLSEEQIERLREINEIIRADGW
mgnify:CR=1 FL=1